MMPLWSWHWPPANGGDNDTAPVPLWCHHGPIIGSDHRELRPHVSLSYGLHSTHNNYNNSRMKISMLPPSSHCIPCYMYNRYLHIFLNVKIHFLFVKYLTKISVILFSMTEKFWLKFVEIFWGEEHLLQIYWRAFYHLSVEPRKLDMTFQNRKEREETGWRRSEIFYFVSDYNFILT